MRSGADTTNSFRMSTRRLQSDSYSSSYDDIISSDYTEEDEEESSTQSKVPKKRTELPKTFLIAGLAVTLLALSVLAIAWKKGEKSPALLSRSGKLQKGRSSWRAQSSKPDQPEVVGVIPPPLKKPSEHRALAVRVASDAARNASARPRTRQIMVPGRRAFAGEPTTELSMMEIADLNFDSLRSKGSMYSEVTTPSAEPEVNEPFRRDAFTFHWRAAVGRKDVVVHTGVPRIWLATNATSSPTPNLVRRFIGRRGFPVASTTTLQSSESPSSSESTVVISVSGPGETPASNATIVSLGSLSANLSAEAAAQPFKKTAEGTSAGGSSRPPVSIMPSGKVDVIPMAPITEETSQTARSSRGIMIEIDARSLPRGAIVLDTETTAASSSGALSSSVHGGGPFSGSVESWPTTSRTSRQDNAQGGIGRIVPIFDVNEPPQKAPSTPESATPFNLSARNAPTHKALDTSTKLSVAGAGESKQDVPRGPNASTVQTESPQHFPEAAGAKIGVVDANLPAHDERKLETLSSTMSLEASSFAVSETPKGPFSDLPPIPGSSLNNLSKAGASTSSQSPRIDSRNNTDTYLRVNGSTLLPASPPLDSTSNDRTDLRVFSVTDTGSKVDRRISEKEPTPTSAVTAARSFSSPMIASGTQSRIGDIENTSLPKQAVNGMQSVPAQNEENVTSSAGYIASREVNSSKHREGIPPFENSSHTASPMLSTANFINLNNGSEIAGDKSTTTTESNEKKRGVPLNDGNLSASNNVTDISPLNVSLNASGAVFSLPPSRTNDLSGASGVQELAATNGTLENKTRQEENLTKGGVSDVLTGQPAINAGDNSALTSLSTDSKDEAIASRQNGSTTSGLLGGSSPTLASENGSVPEVATTTGPGSVEGNVTEEDVHLTALSRKEGHVTGPAAKQSTASVVAQTETTLTTQRTRRRIRMSRRGRKRVLKKATVRVGTPTLRNTPETTMPTDTRPPPTSTPASRMTRETTRHFENRYPPVKHPKRKRRLKSTRKVKVPSALGTKSADNGQQSSQRRDASSSAGEKAKRYGEAERGTSPSTTASSYQPRIKAIEITHRHDLQGKRNTPEKATPRKRIQSDLGKGAPRRDTEWSSEQENDTFISDGTYQHAGMNPWQMPKDLSKLQKQHPGPKRKWRQRGSHRLGPREIPKHAALTRPPLKMPMEWSAERPRLRRISPSTSFSKTKRSSTLRSTTGSTIGLLALRRITSATDETNGAPLRISVVSAPAMRRTWGGDGNVTVLNVTENTGENTTSSPVTAAKFLNVTTSHHNVTLTSATGGDVNETTRATTESESNGTRESTGTTTPTSPSTPRVTLYPVDNSSVSVHCATADCMEEGRRLHLFTDLKQKPCSNFYEFSCSGWIRTHPYPKNRRKVSVDDVIVQTAEQKTMEFIYGNVPDPASYSDPLLYNVVKLFQGCSDKSFLIKNPAVALQTALDDIRLTDWPYDEEPLDLDIPEVMAFAARKLGVHPLFIPSVEVDDTTGSGWIFVLKHPRTVIPENVYLAGDFKTRYQKLVTKSMSLVNSDKNIQALAEPVLDIDYEVYKMVEKNDRLTDYTGEHYRKNVAAVNKKREFDIGSFLSTLVDGLSVVESDADFVMPSASFLQDVLNITVSFDKISLLNYIGFRAMLVLSPLLPHNEGRDLAHLHYAREIPTRTPPKRWRFCVRLLESVYKLPLLQLQVQSFEKKDTFHTLNRTIELLKKYMFRTVRNSSRFGQATREMVIRKLRDLQFHSYSSPQILDPEIRERHYHGVPDLDPTNVLSDYIQTLSIVLKNYWSYYGSMGPHFRWHGSVFDTVATYNHFENTLYIPPSLFMEDVKYNTFHSPLYFPRSGRRIAEAMYDMLEREASFFGVHNEVLRSSHWDYTTADGYLSLRSCLKDQFRRASMPHLGSGLMAAVPMSRPLRQDVRDNGVINVVYEAFKETMMDFGYKPGVFTLPGFAETSMDQLFFLLYGTSQCEVTTQEAAVADEVVHASHPRRYRVNHALQNNQLFSRAFMCPSSAGMNPKKKCRVW